MTPSDQTLLPTWERRWDTERVIKDLAELAEMQGQPGGVTLKALRCAVVLLAQLLRLEVRAFPFIYSDPDGGIEIAFDFLGGSVSLWISADGAISATATPVSEPRG